MSNNVFISSFIAGSVQTILGHPFDTIKTRMQIYDRSAKFVIQDILKKEGIKALYKGSFTPLISGCIQNSILFTSESYFQNYIKNNFMTGFIAGSLSSLVISPAELIKCHIQNKKESHIKFNDVKFILDSKKISLSCGLKSTFLRDSLGLGVYFGSYNYFQKSKNDPFLNGGIAGVLSWIVSYPFDVIKTRKQITNQSYKDILADIKYKQYIRGLNVVLVRSFIVNAGIFCTYENLLKKELVY